MPSIDLTLSTSNAEITAGIHGLIDVELEDVDTGDLLDSIGIDDVIDHFSQSNILDHIGKEDVIAYFGIEEKEEE